MVGPAISAMTAADRKRYTKQMDQIVAIEREILASIKSMLVELKRTNEALRAVMAPGRHG
jgi:hypothetical protein